MPAACVGGNASWPGAWTGQIICAGESIQSPDLSPWATTTTTSSCPTAETQGGGYSTMNPHGDFSRSGDSNVTVVGAGPFVIAPEYMATTGTNWNVTHHASFQHVQILHHQRTSSPRRARRASWRPRQRATRPVACLLPSTSLWCRAGHRRASPAPTAGTLPAHQAASSFTATPRATRRR